MQEGPTAKPQTRRWKTTPCLPARHEKQEALEPRIRCSSMTEHISRCRTTPLLPPILLAQAWFSHLPQPSSKTALAMDWPACLPCFPCSAHGSPAPRNVLRPPGSSSGTATTRARRARANHGRRGGVPCVDRWWHHIWVEELWVSVASHPKKCDQAQCTE